MDVLSPFIPVLCHSDWLFHGESCPRLDVVPSRPCVAFLAFVHLSLILALSLSPGNSLVSSCCDHSMLSSLLWQCLTVPSLLQLCKYDTLGCSTPQTEIPSASSKNCIQHYVMKPLHVTCTCMYLQHSKYSGTALSNNSYTWVGQMPTGSHIHTTFLHYTIIPRWHMSCI